MQTQLSHTGFKRIPFYAKKNTKQYHEHKVLKISIIIYT